MMQAPQQMKEITNDPTPNTLVNKDDSAKDTIEIESCGHSLYQRDNLRDDSSEWTMGQDLSSVICDNIEFSKVFNDKASNTESHELIGSGIIDLGPFFEMKGQTMGLSETGPCPKEITMASNPWSDDYVQQIMHEDLPLETNPKKMRGLKKRRRKSQVNSDDYLSIADFIGSSISCNGEVASLSSTCTDLKSSISSKIFCNPTRRDVLLGRGGLANRHIGNKFFRDEARKLKSWYNTSSKQEKYTISEVLVEYIHSTGGRFLEQDGESKRWYEVTMKRARAKASQALREEKIHKKVRIAVASP
uniref:DUF6824 domain-containing protein n=1 Tax=Ditylum brightwellii TaxID=49249 RepID=A0A6V2PIJ6_9STRA|mmetsp:Transcript_32777/g.43706  ORF Transcript_32777/g.43706 Transcript_32777/m.43706 type:complete len:303 (+) Transcript_32777:185-1093(+)